MLTELYPIKIAKSLGINYGRYIAKLNYPDKFTLEEILRLVNLLIPEPDIIYRAL